MADSERTRLLDDEEDTSYTAYPRSRFSNSQENRRPLSGNYYLDGDGGLQSPAGAGDISRDHVVSVFVVAFDTKAGGYCLHFTEYAWCIMDLSVTTNCQPEVLYMPSAINIV